jgi:hypothetical protein
MSTLSFLLKRWQYVGLGLAGLATLLVILHIRGTIDGLEAELATAQEREAKAIESLAVERASVDTLEATLAEEREQAQADRLAREAAAQQRDEDRAADQEADASLGETIIIERQADVTLDQCLAIELPDSVLRELP